MFPLIPVLFGAGFLILLDQACRNAPQQRQNDDEYGAVPPPPAAAASGASVLQSAALASPGSWTQRNVLQAGAQSAWQRRLSGKATNADYAVLAAARPGIASGVSGPISGAWSGSPWQYGPGTPPGPRGDEDIDDLDEGDGLDQIGDAVLKEMGLS